MMHVQAVLVDTLIAQCMRNVFLLNFKKEGTDYAFYMRDYKGQAIKLLPFYMAIFLFREL